MNRRELLGSVGAGALVVVLSEGRALAHPPSEEDEEERPRRRPPQVRVDGRISRNHGHVLALSLTDIAAGVDRTFDLTGTGGHKHEVTFTKAHLAELQRAKIVRLASTRASDHVHEIYARVRPVDLPPDEVSVCSVVIGGKDDHELVIPRSHLEAPADRTYDIQANSPHTHQVTIRAAEFARLKKGEKVDLVSGPGADDRHTHPVSIRVAP